MTGTKRNDVKKTDTLQHNKRFGASGGVTSNNPSCQISNFASAFPPSGGLRGAEIEFA